MTRCIDRFYKGMFLLLQLGTIILVLKVIVLLKETKSCSYGTKCIQRYKDIAYNNTHECNNLSITIHYMY
jgi:hypothetical protein